MCILLSIPLLLLQFINSRANSKEVISEDAKEEIDALIGPVPASVRPGAK